MPKPKVGERPRQNVSARIPSILDPRTIFAIHTERAAGLTATQISTRYNLPGVTVQQFLRPRANTTLATPFDLSRSPEDLTEAAGVQMYWLGFLAAAGRVYAHNGQRTVILSLDSEDMEIVQTLVRDLLKTHPSYEICHSSLEGHQAYIRDRDLGEALLHWGMANSPAAVELSLEHVPDAMLPHLIRGLLEGALIAGRGVSSGQTRNGPGAKPRPASPRALREKVQIYGSVKFLEALRARLKAVSASMTGRIQSAGAGEEAVLVFQRTGARALLQYAYRNPIRTRRSEPFLAALTAKKRKSPAR